MITISLFFSITLIDGLKHLFDNYYKVMQLEFGLTYNWDSPIYWAVGRGLLNNITPYIGLFETKPPGIFFISALSFLLVGDVSFGNALQAVLLIFISITPLIYTIVIHRKAKLAFKVVIITTSIFIGTAIMLYTSFRSGKYQVEGYASSFTCMYILIIALMNTNKTKYYSTSVLFAGLFAMLAVMFKEPFLLVLIASCFLFINNINDFKYKLILPLIYGGIMGVILLASTNSLLPYINIYLRHMLGNHINIYGPIYERIFRFDKVFIDISTYSKNFFLLIILLLMFYSTISLNDISIMQDIRYEEKHKLGLYSIKIPFTVMLIMASISLGGQFFDHHFAFATPYYVALAMFFIYRINTIEYKFLKYGALALFYIVSVQSVIYIDNNTMFFPQPLFEYNVAMREQAQYVDDVLDTLEVDRYLHLGFNQGYKFYGFTKHSPSGPIFMQDPNNFVDENSWFAIEFKKQLDEAEIIVIDKHFGYNVNSLNGYTNDYLNAHFTENLPQEILNLEVPEAFSIRYKLLFRIS